MADREFGSDDLPDPREIFERMKKNMRFVWIGGGVILALLVAWGSFFQVEPEEEAIVLRFGKPTGAVYKPGLHFKIPLVDQVFKAPVERQHRLEFGFRSEPGKQATAVEKRPKESLMLTGDLQLVHVEWSLIYQIDELETYIFEVKDQEDTIRDISSAIMRQLVGDYSLHEVLTVKVRELQEEARRTTQSALSDKVPTGVIISELAIRATDVPARAKEIFDEFNRTEPDIRRELDEAKTAALNVTGEAEKIKKIAVGQAQKQEAQIIENAQGEARAFLAQMKEFEVAPDLTRQFLYLDSMQRVMAAVEEKILIDDSAGNTLNLLPLTDPVRTGVRGGGGGKSTAGGNR